MDLHNLFQRAGLMFMIHDILVEVCYMVTLCKSMSASTLECGMGYNSIHEHR